MNISISWGNYCLLVAFCLVVYYLSIYLMFFVHVFQRSESKRYVFAKDTFGKSNNEYSSRSQASLFPADEVSINSDAKENIDSITIAVQEFVHEFNSLLEQIQLEPFTKEIIIDRLRQLLKKYNQIKDSDYKQSINNLIAVECENSCDIKLTAQEIAELWH